MSKIEIEKREGREEKLNKSTARTQERIQYARGIRILQVRKQPGGGVAPRRNNRITTDTKRQAKKATKW